MPDGDTSRDWTGGPAKWFAVGVLATLSTGALGWSIIRASAGREPLISPANNAATPPSSSLAPTQPTTAPQQLHDSRSIEQPVASAVAEPKTRADSMAKDTLARTININTASAAELELLPGIGPALAQRIIEARNQRGGFKTVDELDDVRGIGPKLLAKLRDRVSVE